VFDLGLSNLRERFGLRIKEYPTARMPAAETYRNPKIRAEDINRAFADPEVNAIFASIGGDDSIRILPYLDMATIVANPKVFMGYSDTTTMLAYLNVHGLVTFNGPAVMAGFAQMQSLPLQFEEHVGDILFEPSDRYQYAPFGKWSDGYPDWKDPSNNGKVEPPKTESRGWQWVQGSGVARGTLFGGNIEVLDFLKGTRFQPPSEHWKGKIVFFETSEDKPSVSEIVYTLRNYGMQGVLDEISALLFGRARSYSEAEKLELEAAVRRVVSVEFGNETLPIVMNLDFGHTDPQWIMPLGVKAEIDCDRRTIALVEPAVRA
jgi:muramoyltetrapeptide carboxypeptidase LdcA involved in peptidoglycan recycling